MIAFDELKAELLADPEFAKEYEKARIEWTDLWRLRMAYGLLKGSESAFQEMRAMMEEWDEKKTGYFKDVARIIATHKVSVDEALDILKENHPDWNPTYYAGKSCGAILVFPSIGTMTISIGGMGSPLPSASLASGTSPLGRSPRTCRRMDRHINRLWSCIDDVRKALAKLGGERLENSGEK